MRKKWEEPSIQIQKFMPNEYVAACWGVACHVGPANEVEKAWYKDDDRLKNIFHRAEHCGQSSNQVLIDRNDNGIPEKMIEVGTDGLDELSCQIFTDQTYRKHREISSIRTGDYIYWETSAGNKTWHHQGLVKSTVPGHPNRS